MYDRHFTCHDCSCDLNGVDQRCLGSRKENMPSSSLTRGKSRRCAQLSQAVSYHTHVRRQSTQWQDWNFHLRHLNLYLSLLTVIYQTTSTLSATNVLLKTNGSQGVLSRAEPWSSLLVILNFKFSVTVYAPSCYVKAPSSLSLLLFTLS